MAWRKPTFGYCLSLCTLVGIVGVVIPALVLSIAAFFALCLWPFECRGAWLEYQEHHPGADHIRKGSPEELRCQYYSWFLYISGNLLGLATPLTSVTTQSGHIAPAIIDLVVSTWSLSLAGIVIGAIASLSAMDRLTNRINWLISTSATVRLVKKFEGEDSTVGAEQSAIAEGLSNVIDAEMDEVRAKLDTFTEQLSALTQLVNQQQQSMAALTSSISEQHQMLDRQQKALDKLAESISANRPHLRTRSKMLGLTALANQFPDSTLDSERNGILAGDNAFETARRWLGEAEPAATPAASQASASSASPPPRSAATIGECGPVSGALVGAEPAVDADGAIWL